MKKILLLSTLLISLNSLFAQDTVFVEITKPDTAYDLFMPELSEYILTAKVSNTDTLHSISDAFFSIDGQNITTIPHGDYYIARWTPPAYSTYAIRFMGVSTSGAVEFDNHDITINDTPTDITVRALEDARVKFGGEGRSVFHSGYLPNHVGAYDSLHAVLDVVCPSGDCDPYDRVAWINIKSADGTWVELIHYITSFGTSCTHEIDLTEYLFLLNGEVEFEIFVDTWAGSWEFTLDLEYYAGTPEHKYGKIEPIYDGLYYFGDYANLQPFEMETIEFDSLAVATQFNMLLSGHGWGGGNTNNAAEFYHSIHTLYLDGNSITQDPWRDCNPNPDGCSPQGGTWQYDRSGWCPGAITHPFVYDLDTYLANGSIDFWYEFDTNYIDLCHPNHPSCISGTTCADCNEGYNPQYWVAANLFSYFNDKPYESRFFDNLNVSVINRVKDDFEVHLSPNPADNKVLISFEQLAQASISIHGIDGRVVKRIANKPALENGNYTLDVSDFAAGIYFVEVHNGRKSSVKKLIIK